MEWMLVSARAVYMEGLMSPMPTISAPTASAMRWPSPRALGCPVMTERGLRLTMGM